jgi:inosine-uridine nucleoside N-ribohydrolase
VITLGDQLGPGWRLVQDGDRAEQRWHLEHDQARVGIVRRAVDYDESVGIDGSTHPDPLTLAVLLHPELVLAEAHYRVDVETASELTRGYSAMAWEKFSMPPNPQVVEAVDRERFFGLLEGMLSTVTVPTLPISGLQVG